MLSFDPAFFSFRILFEKNFNVELGRWGSIVSQLLPLWFLKNGCSLETFLRVYSVSFIIIYYVIFLILTVVLRNMRAAVMLMLALCLAFRHAFYYSTAEIYQGTAICVLIWAVAFPENPYLTKPKKNLAAAICFILIIVVSYYHQLLVFPLLFLFIYYLIATKKYSDKLTIGLILFTAAWFFVRIKFLTESTYEKGKIPELRDLIEGFSYITNTSSYAYFKYFVKYFLWSLVVLNFICVVQFFYKHKWLLAFFYIATNAAFIYLNIITYRKGESPLMYENYLTVLGLFCAVPLSEQLIGLKHLKIKLLALTVILLFNIREIYSSHLPFTLKQDYLSRITESSRKMPEKKYVIDSRNFPWQYNWISWTLPFETLLNSSLQSPDSAITVCVANPVNQYDSIATWKNIFIGPSWSPTWFWTNDLDSNYFKLPPTPYGYLTGLQSDSSFKESEFNKKNVFIIPLQSEVTLGREKYTVIPLRIINTSGKKLPAVPDVDHQFFLSYHILSEKGEIIFVDNYRTPLETDVGSKGNVGLIVKTPLKKGKYTILIDFVTENVRWWNIDSKVSLVVI
jgi:hypothetical protein